MEEGDTFKGVEEAVAVVGGTILRAKITMLVLKPLLLTLGFIIYSAIYCAAMYGGTWMVVLALRHAKVL